MTRKGKQTKAQKTDKQICVVNPYFLARSYHSSLEKLVVCPLDEFCQRKYGSANRELTKEEINLALVEAGGFYKFLMQYKDLFAVTDNRKWVYLPGTNPFGPPPRQKGEYCAHFMRYGCCWQYQTCDLVHDCVKYGEMKKSGEIDMFYPKTKKARIARKRAIRRRRRRTRARRMALCMGK